jgi:hypothetical protein
MLPPPDPHEDAFAEPDGTNAVPAPMVVFAPGEASEAEKRLADAILDARPGLLIMVPVRR